MSDTSEIERPVQFGSRIGTGEMIGAERQTVHNEPEGSRVEIQLGVIYGEARGISFRNNSQNAETGPARALIGMFEFVPANPARPLIRSTICFLPAAIHDIVVNAVLAGQDPAVMDNPKRGKKIDQPGVKVPICYLVSVKKALQAGGVGYQFVTVQVKALGQVDPFISIRRDMGDLPQLQHLPTTTGVTIEHDADTGEVAEAEADDKPAKLAGKVKGKGKAR